jgi:chromosomal replication initiator protein
MSVRSSEGPVRAATELWHSAFAKLSGHLKKEQLQTWFHRVSPVDFDGQTLILAVPSEFHRNWILDNYMPAIVVACREVLGFAADVTLQIDPEWSAAAASSSAANPTFANPAPAIPAASSGAFAVAASAPGSAPSAPIPAPFPADDDSRARRAAGANGYPIGSSGDSAAARPLLAKDSGSRDSASSVSLNPHYVFENFVVGPCNRFAYAGAMGVAEKPATAYNPLFLHGSVGLGKTHLLQAICHETLRRRPETRILYLSCETFTNHFIAAIEKGALEDFRRRYRGVDFLVVDDVQFLANKERTQEEFFHTFNTLFHDNKQIVLSSDSPPHVIPSLQERLVSRFKWGLEAEIEKPCFETRLAILQRKARTMGPAFPEDVTQFLAERITNNIRELEGAINRIGGYAGLQREVVTLELVRRIMPELDADRNAVVRFEDVANVVAKKYHVKILDLQSRRRSQSIAFPRQIAMFLSRRHTNHSLVEIGAYFGGRDHTTVLYAIDKITALAKDDAEMRDVIYGLTEEIGRHFPAGGV